MNAAYASISGGVSEDGFQLPLAKGKAKQILTEALATRPPGQAMRLHVPSPRFEEPLQFDQKGVRENALRDCPSDEQQQFVLR